MNEENKRKMCPIRKMVYCDHKCGWYYKGRCAMVAVAEELYGDFSWDYMNRLMENADKKSD